MQSNFKLFHHSTERFRALNSSGQKVCGSQKPTLIEFFAKGCMQSRGDVSFVHSTKMLLATANLEPRLEWSFAQILLRVGRCDNRVWGRHLKRKSQNGPA